jgi:hypothetical protein
VLGLPGDPSRIDLSLDSRAVSFENPTGERSAGGKAERGRKGAPSRVLDPGERVRLAELEGPGTIRHLWMTFPPAPPGEMRALVLEAFYDGLTDPSVSVPCLDFFGCPLGRPVAYDSALTSVHEGRGLNSYWPIPFRKRVRVDLVNRSRRRVPLYYQIDYTLEPDLPEECGYLHAAFRRENPTQRLRDFVIAEGLEGPGRFAGSSLGIRVLDGGMWYGEGEVKIYRDGDREGPTICGTGLEDYVGSAWGMGAHQGLYAGVPLVVRAPGARNNPDFVGLYRWHLPDPIVFRSDLHVTVQQIGYAAFREGEAREFEEFARVHPAAGRGWEMSPRRGIHAQGIFERVDDYCATSYVYCLAPQAVPRLDVEQALADIERRDYEEPSPLERLFSS